MQVAWLQMSSMQACLRPFLVACETKSPKLANFSLLCLQKLQTQYHLGEPGLLLVIKAIEQVNFPTEARKHRMVT